jgi:hypothetical protein
MELDVRAAEADAATLQFFATHDTRATLGAYVQGRGITGD